MNWVKQNKFLTGFIVVLVIGLGVLGYLAFTASGAYDEALNQYTQKSQEYNRLRGLNPFPSKKNLDEYEVQKKEAHTAITAFQADLAKKEFPLEQVSPIEFQDRLKAAVVEVVGKAKEAGVNLAGKETSEKFYLGFNRYETTPPATEAAAPLARQLKAIKWAVDQCIAPTGADHVTSVSVDRPELPEEKGAKAANSGNNQKPGNQGKGPGGNNGRRDGRSDLVVRHPFYLSMICRQPTLAAVLNVITGTKAPQFYIPSGLRVVNEKQAGPVKVLGGATAGSGSPDEKAEKNGYIVGEEQIQATIRLDIVNFAEVTPEN